MILLRVPAVVSLLLSAIIIASPTDSAADAMRLLDSNQAAAARRVVDAALANTPGSPLLLAVQARILWAQGQRDAALHSASRAERAGPKDPTTQHVLALFYAQSGNRPKAAELESRFARSPEADRAAAGRAAFLNFEVGRTDQAIVFGERALAIEDRPDVRRMLTRAYEKAGKPDDAVRHYAKLLEDQPYDEDSYSLYGQALLRMTRFTQALTVLEEGQKKFDKSPQITLALGVTYYAQRRFPDAGDRFLRVIDLAPTVPQPYLFLTKMLDHLEPRMPEILARFEAWNRNETKSPYAPLVFGKALSAAGKPDQAEPLFRESVRRNDELWESHFELGQVLDSRQDLPGATREYERAIALSPRQPAPHYRLARVYLRQGLRDKAAAELKLHSRLLEEDKQRGPLPEGIE